MKYLKGLIAILTLTFISFNSNADNGYESQMKQAMDLFEKANTPDEYQIAANHFSRIAVNVKDRWQPIYYASLIETMQALDAKAIDKFEASAGIAKRALELESKLDLKTVRNDERVQSEIHALLGMMYTVRILLDKSKSEELAPKNAVHVTKALALNPNNPRARLLDCQNLYYSRGNQESVSSLAEKCIPYFVREAAEKPADYMPRWGRAQLDDLLEQIAKK